MYIFISSKDDCILENIIDMYGRLLLCISHGILKDEYLAQDAVQRTYIRIAEERNFSKLKELDEYQKKKYLSKTVRNISIDMLRTNVCPDLACIPIDNEYFNIVSNYNVYSKYCVDSISSFHYRLELQKIINLVDELPENYKNILKKRAFAGLSICEIAKIYGINEALVRKRLSRARKKLHILCSSNEIHTS